MIVFLTTLYFSISLHLSTDNNPFIASKEFGVLHRFQIKGEELYVNRNSGFIYQLINEKLKRIDKSEDLKAYNKSILFQHKDTLYRYGGYGFWSERDHLSYYDRNEKKWFYKNNNGISPKGFFDGYAFTAKNLAFIYGGKYISKKDGITAIPNHQILIYDFNASAFIDILESSFEFNTKMLLGEIDGNVLFHDNQYLYKIDFESMEVIQFLKPNSILEFNNGRDFITTKNNQIKFQRFNVSNPPNSKILHLDELMHKPINSYDLVVRKHNKLLIIPFFLVVLIFLFIIIKTKWTKSGFILTEYSLKKGDKIIFANEEMAKIIKTLLLQEKIESFEVYNIVAKKNFSYSHNMRIKNNVISDLDNILKRISAVEKKHILTQKSATDARNKSFILNPAIKSKIQNLIKIRF